MNLKLYDLFLDWIVTLPKSERKIAISTFVDFASFIETLKEKNDE